MSKRSDPTESTTHSGANADSARDREPLEALRASWQQSESGSGSAAAATNTRPGSAAIDTPPTATSHHESELPAGTLPRTCCPSCLTVFEVSPDLLAAYDTRVRCGECLGIFDALTNLRRAALVDELTSKNSGIQDHAQGSDGAGVPAGGHMGDVATSHHDSDVTAINVAVAASEESLDDDSSVLDATHADFDLYSGEAELPEVAYFDQTLGDQELRLDETRNDDSFSETMFVRDIADQAAAETGADIRDVRDADASSQVPEQPTDAKVTYREADESISAAMPSGSATAAIPMDSSVSYITDDDSSSEESIRFVYDESDDSLPESPAASHAASHSASQTDGRLNLKASNTSATHTAIQSADNDFPDRKRAPGKVSRWRRIPRTWIIRAVLSFIIIVFALSLYAYRERDALLKNEHIRPVLSGICSLVGCQLSAVVDLGSLRVVKRSVFSHPSIEDALVIDLAFINDAHFDQPYPVLEIRLTDNRGGLVTQNNVPPSEYLEQWQPEAVLAAGKRLDLSLTVKDPGQTATSFELKFR